LYIVSFSTFLALYILDRRQLILSSAARAISKTPRFIHISSVLKSLAQKLSTHSLQISLNHLQNTPISQALISAQSSPHPIKHLHSFFYHCLSQNAPQFPLDSKLSTDYLLIIHLFFGMRIPKNFANILLSHFLYFLIYLHLNFTPSLS